MAQAKIHHIVGHDGAVELLSMWRLIVSLHYRNGYLVAARGVNKKTLYKYAKKLDGE